MPRLGLLDLPAAVIERLALVALDEPVWVGCVRGDAGFYARIDIEERECRKRHVFWVLRNLSNRGIAAAAWGARHLVVRANVRSVAALGDAEWLRVLLRDGAE